MRALCECTYCGYGWVQAVYSESLPDDVQCPKAGCRHVGAKLRPFSSTDVFGYADDLRRLREEAEVALKRSNQRLQAARRK